jgi:Tol biopolymer transport system component
MTADRRFERDLPDLLAQLGHGAAPDYRDDIVQQTARMRQRPAWMFPERWLPMDITARRAPAAPIDWRLIAVVALLVVVTAAIVIVGSAARRPAPPYGPAANGLIAYEADGDILLGDPTNGTSRPLITGPTADGPAFFSRDGTRLLVFRENRNGGDHLVVANADGSDLRQLTTERLMDITAGDWSGDGRFIVLVSRQGVSRMTVFEIEADTAIPLDVGMAVTDAFFVPPDSREILFTSGNQSTLAMYLVDRAGGTPRRLAPGGGPRYSPDGSRIAYNVVENVPNSTEVVTVRLHVMNADGTNDIVIADEPGIWYQNVMAWSPDGTKLLVIRGYDENRRRVLAILQADGRGSVTEYDVGLRGRDHWGPTGWSPDGRFVYFAAEGATEAALIDLTNDSMRTVPHWYTASWQRTAP